jgi:hypothetical protein
MVTETPDFPPEDLLDPLPPKSRVLARQLITEFEVGRQEDLKRHPHRSRLGWFAARFNDTVTCLEFYPEERRAHEADLKQRGFWLGTYPTYAAAVIAGLKSLDAQPRISRHHHTDRTDRHG